MRVDFARFCILHSYGGIYADLDIYCYKNFYGLLKRDLYIVESWSQWGEKVQNSLMISSPNQEFWENCMYFSGVKSFLSQENDYNEYVLQSCGPKLISKILDKSVKFLPKEMFNPMVENQFNMGYDKAIEDFNNLKDDQNVFTRHFLTGTW